MEQEILDKINNYVIPFCEKFKTVVKSVYIAGSAVRQKDYVKGSDIDILVIVDDTREDFDKRVIDLMNMNLRDISKTAMTNDKLDLHMQAPKPLTVFWDMVRSGQPWIITQMRDALILYDPSGYIKPIQILLNDGKLSGTKERSQTLINDAPKKLGEARKIFLEDITSDLLSAMVESAQAVLMFSGVAPPASKNIGRELSKRFVDTKIIPARIVQDYERMYETTRKIDHGEITNVSGREIDKYIGMVTEFIESMEKLFNVLDFMKKKKMVNEAYDKTIDACSSALKKAGKVKPKDHSEILKHFKVHFIDTGLVSKDHIETLKKMHTNKKAFDSGNVSDISEDEIYSSNIYATNLQKAIGDVKIDGGKEKNSPKRNKSKK
ncbi:MAG: nucleotidyltransferase domain-containing protein [DPANN group archaeon]|nr:nucleotidyltransferase domain-containing protein [DPANN group archaeon]